jgi:murein L,D-transpeptidase YafK
MRDGRPFMNYPVSLGRQPAGHKEREGDGRTPEGRYVLDWRNPNSRFHKSLHVSYPGPADRLRARRLGVDPGGMIMIHGQPRPNEHADLQAVVARDDWTDGCIAVSNHAMDEIWDKTRDGTPIEILP